MAEDQSESKLQVSLWNRILDWTISFLFFLKVCMTSLSLSPLTVDPLINLPTDINSVIAAFMGGDWLGWCVYECSEAPTSAHKRDSWLWVMEMSSKFKGPNRGHRRRSLAEGQQRSQAMCWMERLRSKNNFHFQFEVQAHGLTGITDATEMWMLGRGSCILCWPVCTCSYKTRGQTGG